MTDDRLSLEALLLSRAYLYEMFHKTFGGTPSAELLDALSDKCAIDVADEYSHADSVMSSLVSFLISLKEKAQDEKYLDNIRDEYTRLFIGPNRLPVLPWASPYVSRDPVFFQESTLTVRDAYKEHGLKPKVYLHVPDDHVALMNGFMSILAQKSLKYFHANKYEELQIIMAKQKSFLDAHLNNWLSKFSEGLLHADSTGFYATLAEASATFCKLDTVFINEATEWLETNANMPIDDEPYVTELLKPISVSFDTLRGVQLFGLEDNELQEI